MILRTLLTLFIFALGTTVSCAEIILLKDKDNVQISRYDMDALLEEGPIDAQLITLNNQERMIQLSEQIYLTKLVSNIARNEGLADDPLIKAKLDRMIDRFLFSLYMQRQDEKAPDLTAAAEERYTANPEDYRVPKMVDFSHVLISTNPKLPTYHAEEEALKLALDIQSRAKDGEPFKKLVRDYSEDLNKSRNKGRIGFMPKKRLIAPIGEAVFMLNQGDISDPVKSEQGYHVIKVHRVQEEMMPSFDDVKDTIITDLKKEYIQAHREAYFTDIKEGREAKLFEKALNDYTAVKQKELGYEGEDKQPKE